MYYFNLYFSEESFEGTIKTTLSRSIIQDEWDVYVKSEMDERFWGVEEFVDMLSKKYPTETTERTIMKIDIYPTKP